MIWSGLTLEDVDVVNADWESADGQPLSALEAPHSTPSRR
jgi:hypothetical protein